jgi:hypothetical protein
LIFHQEGVSLLKAGDIITYDDIRNIEKAQIQHGMTFRSDGRVSVFLMSQQDNAKYEDELVDDGKGLIYEGHDEPRRKGSPDPKTLNQPLKTPKGSPTANGKFLGAAELYQAKGKIHLVAVYEKIKKGLWTFNGIFSLVDAYPKTRDGRIVYKFKLELYADKYEGVTSHRHLDLAHTRMIPSHVKQEVFKRDKGRCVTCGATDNLHYDHELPFSKGGTSLSASNIRLLCARHNLQKRDNIE